MLELKALAQLFRREHEIAQASLEQLIAENPETACTSLGTEDKTQELSSGTELLSAKVSVSAPKIGVVVVRLINDDYLPGLRCVNDVLNC